MRPAKRDDRNAVKRAYRAARKEANKANAPAASKQPKRKNNYGVDNSKAWAAEMKKLPCYYCGAPGGTIDHRIPVSHGGRSIKENCVPACGWCNSHKGQRTEEEFRAWLVRNHFI